MTDITKSYDRLSNLYTITEANKDGMSIASEENKTIGDQILATYRELLENHDQVPAIVHQNMCEYNGWTFKKIDPVTQDKFITIEGDEPPKTHKTYSSRIKAYHAKKHDLKVDTMSQLRKVLEKPKDMADALIKKYRKLSDKDKLRFEAALMQEAKTVGQIDLHKNKKAA